MQFFGYDPSPTEIAVFSAAAGVAVATATLLVNMIVEAVKQAGGRDGKGIRRCSACTEPAEPGGALCYKHARISQVIRSRRVGGV